MFRRVLVISAAAATMVVAGCSSSHPAPSKSSGSAAKTAIPAAPIPGKSGVQGALADLTANTCTYSGGAWNFTGTLKNSQQASEAYTVRMSVSDSKTSSVVGARNVVKTLAAGKSADLSEKAFLSTPSSNGLSCIVSVTRVAS